MLFESMFEGFALLLLCSARLNSHGRSIRCTVIDKLRFRNPLLIEPSIWGVFISVSVSKNPHSHCLPTFLLPTFMHSKFSTILSEPYIYLMNIIFSEEGGQHRFLLLLLEGSFFFLSSPLLHLFILPLSSCALLSSLFPSVCSCPNFLEPPVSFSRIFSSFTLLAFSAENSISSAFRYPSSLCCASFSIIYLSIRICSSSIRICYSFSLLYCSIFRIACSSSSLACSFSNIICLELPLILHAELRL